MQEINFWTEIQHALLANEKVELLLVTNSYGSSPGRKGFKMFITETQHMRGSIGGGIMEHKLIELAKKRIQNTNNPTIVKKQIHNKDALKDQSGMICSGWQEILMYSMSSKDLPTLRALIENLIQRKLCTLSFFDSQISIGEHKSSLYNLDVNNQSVISIIGGGHVGKALSKQMQFLDFYVKVFDDREGLNTLLDNEFAHEKNIVEYTNFHNQIHENEFVVIMSFGYRTDKIVLHHLLNSKKKFKYLGMMGSVEKVKALQVELLNEGISKEILESVKMPIGIQIKSKTPEEIAVSIAAEIIKIKNKDK